MSTAATSRTRIAVRLPRWSQPGHTGARARLCRASAAAAPASWRWKTSPAFRPIEPAGRVLVQRPLSGSQ